MFYNLSKRQVAQQRLNNLPDLFRMVVYPAVVRCVKDGVGGTEEGTRGTNAADSVFGAGIDPRCVGAVEVVAVAETNSVNVPGNGMERQVECT